MIKITNGTNILNVTTGLYNSLYSRMGYRPVGAKKVEKTVEPVKETKKEEVVVTYSNQKSGKSYEASKNNK